MGGQQPAAVRKCKRRSNNTLYKKVRRKDKVCRYCLSAPAESVDHIIPLSRGGADRRSNLVGCCLECNSRKADFLPEEIGMFPVPRP